VQDLQADPDPGEVEARRDLAPHVGRNGDIEVHVAAEVERAERAREGELLPGEPRGAEAADARDRDPIDRVPDGQATRQRGGRQEAHVARPLARDLTEPHDSQRTKRNCNCESPLHRSILLNT